jgi:hypothetical protein
LYPQGTGNAWAIFDLALGTITAVSALNYVSSAIVPVGSGWYRCSITLNATAGSLFCNAYLTNASGTPAPSYTGDGNSGVYIYGAMLSNSASLDPYVPTPGAAPSSTAYYGPRFDYDPVTLLPRGLLIEEQRTNLQLHSGSPQNAAGWTATTSQGVNAFGSGSVANAINAPDGTQTAAFITEDTTGGTHYCFGVQSSTATTKTWSVWLKAGTRTRASIQIGASGGTVGVYADINLTNGTIGAATVSGTGFSISGTPSIQRFGNDWYRCSITAVTPASPHVGYIFLLDAAGNRTYTGNGTSGLYVWGGQLEDGAYATSYIPTIASTVTRSADVAAITGSLFSQWYNQTEGSFLVEASSINVNAGIRRMPLALSDAALTFQQNKISPMYDVGSFNTFAMWVFGTASNILARPSPSVVEPAVGVTSKLAFTIKSSDTAAAVNGNTPGVATTAYPASLPMQLLRMGNESILDAQGNFNGHIRSIRYVPVRAADFQLQQVTT